MGLRDKTNRAYDEAARTAFKDHLSKMSWAGRVRAVWEDWSAFAFGAICALALIVAVIIVVQQFPSQ